MKRIAIEIDEPELTGPELAERLRCDPGTVRNYRKEGMPGRQVGYRKFLYRLSVVNSWLEAHEAKKERERQMRARARVAKQPRAAKAK